MMEIYSSRILGMGLEVEHSVVERAAACRLLCYCRMTTTCAIWSPDKAALKGANNNCRASVQIARILLGGDTYFKFFGLNESEVDALVVASQALGSPAKRNVFSTTADLASLFAGRSLFVSVVDLNKQGGAKSRAQSMSCHEIDWRCSGSFNFLVSNGHEWVCLGSLRVLCYPDAWR